MKEYLTVGILAASNVVAAAAAKSFNFLDVAEPYLHFLIGVGQVGVSLVTIFYIVKKIRGNSKNQKENEK